MQFLLYFTLSVEFNGSVDDNQTKVTEEQDSTYADFLFLSDTKLKVRTSVHISYTNDPVRLKICMKFILHKAKLVTVNRCAILRSEIHISIKNIGKERVSVFKSFVCHF